MSDIIDLLSGAAGSEVAKLRDLRPEAKANAEKSFVALLEPEQASGFSALERYAVAMYVAGLHRHDGAVAFYGDLLADELEEDQDRFFDTVRAAIASGAAQGPYGEFREPGLIARSEKGPSISNESFAEVLGERLVAAFDVAHLMVLHPRDSRPEVIGRLSGAGWNADATVSLTQLVSFLCFQLRVAHGLAVLAGNTPEQTQTDAAGGSSTGAEVDWQLDETGFEVQTYPDLARPQQFVNHALGWRPWVPPVEKSELTEKQLESLIKPERADMPYFRLLARDPAALKARTLTDLDIFYNTDGDGLGRAERELAATVTSISNGCVYCASVHAGRAEEESGRADDVNRLIDDGTHVDLGTTVWNAVRDAALALTATPVRFDAAAVDGLREVGLGDAAIVDMVNSAAFFSWANRLMLVLGEPEVPKRFR